MQNLIYPMKVISFTQLEYDANPDHSHHLIAAIDMNGKDGGVDECYAPCNLRVFKKDDYANTVYFSTLEKVMGADGKASHFTIAMTHDSYIDDIAIGQTFYTGQKFYDEGKKNATGNHVHIEVARGQNQQKAYYTIKGKRQWTFNPSVAVKPTTVFFALKGWNVLRSGYQMGVDVKWCIDRYVEDDIDMRLKINCVKGAQYIRQGLSFGSNNKSNSKILACIPKGNNHATITGFVDGIQKDGYQWVKVYYNGYDTISKKNVEVEGYCQWDSKYFSVYEY